MSRLRRQLQKRLNFGDDGDDSDAASQCSVALGHLKDHVKERRGREIVVQKESMTDEDLDRMAASSKYGFRAELTQGKSYGRNGYTPVSTIRFTKVRHYSPWCTRVLWICVILWFLALFILIRAWRSLPDPVSDVATVATYLIEKTPLGTHGT